MKKNENFNYLLKSDDIDSYRHKYVRNKIINNIKNEG